MTNTNVIINYPMTHINIVIHTLYHTITSIGRPTLRFPTPLEGTFRFSLVRPAKATKTSKSTPLTTSTMLKDEDHTISLYSQGKADEITLINADCLIM